MLAAKKPLAWFYEEVNCLPREQIIPEERFRPYVESGVFVRYEALFEDDYLPKLGRKAVSKKCAVRRAGPGVAHSGLPS